MSIYVSLETAEKLKAAGWVKKTQFCYGMHEENARLIYLYYCLNVHTDIQKLYEAPTTDEIMADLPKSITLKSQKCELAMFKKNNSYEIGYFMGEFYQYAIAYEDKQLCEALAELWLWAKSSGYIKSEATENES